MQNTEEIMFRTLERQLLSCTATASCVSANLWLNHRDMGMTSCDQNELDIDPIHALPVHIRESALSSPGYRPEVGSSYG